MVNLDYVLRVVAECGQSIHFKGIICNIGSELAFDFTTVNYDTGKITIAVNNNKLYV